MTTWSACGRQAVPGSYTARPSAGRTTAPRAVRKGKPVALLRLVQDQQVSLEPMQPGQALAEVVSNMPIIPADPRMGEAVLARGQAVLTAVPAYRLHFLPVPTFWEVIDALPL